MERQKRYYRFSNYLKGRFGTRIYKVSIDAGFSCPNKDGTLSSNGCIFCDNRAFSYNTRPVRNLSTDRQDSLSQANALPLAGISNGARIQAKPLEEQIEEGMDFGRLRYGAEKFIIYFQAYTNTYAPLNILKERYDTVKNFKDIVGISIGTRPDCVNEEILDLIENYSKDYEVWIEYGLQSINENSLKLINRNHTYQDFLKAYDLTKKRNIKVCAHVIIGLPEEERDEIIETAKEMGRIKLDGVKIHPLYIIKGTRLDELFRAGLHKPLELDKFVELAIEFLKYLSPETVIQRITADCPREFLVAPSWILKKNLVLTTIAKKLIEQDLFQGMLYNKR